MLPTNTLYIGNLNIVEEEKEFLSFYKIQIINKSDISRDAALIKNVLRDFVMRFDHLHISFDIDVFDKSVVKATGTPSKHGLLEEDIFPLLEVLSEHKEISIDLVEVNPKKEGGKQTVEIAREIICLLTKGLGL